MRHISGIIQAIALQPRACVVYAPVGSCTRFRRATAASVVGHNMLGGTVLSVAVRVPGHADMFVVPPAWIDPPDAPAPDARPDCVVIPFIGCRRP